TKVINSNWLQQAILATRNLSQKQVASILGIHRNTLRYKLWNMGIHKRFSGLDDNDLDRILKLYKHL
ncbi:hypothetical protein JB92DRAFT_3243345, partial [Gautieria morchelliformis]